MTYFDSHAKGGNRAALGFYSLAPGAELEVGPHGKLYETLGAVPARALRRRPRGRRARAMHGALGHTHGGGTPCCSGCAKTGGSCGSGGMSGLGALPASLAAGAQFAGAGGAAPGSNAPQVVQVTAANPDALAPTTDTTDNTSTYLLLGALGLGIYLVIKKRERQRAAAGGTTTVSISSSPAPTSNPWRRRPGRRR